jgi:death on curing protein
MTFVLVPSEVVIALHDAALNPGELPGLAGDKSLVSALARVENRLAYGLIGDLFDLAAAYAAAVAQDHCFNDGNTRAAFDTMAFCLEENGVATDWADPIEIGNLIIALAQRQIDDGHLADWLRERCP